MLKLETIKAGPLLAAIKKEIQYNAPPDDLTVWADGWVRWFIPSRDNRHWSWDMDTGRLRLIPIEYKDLCLSMDAFRVRALLDLSMARWNGLTTDYRLRIVKLYRTLVAASVSEEATKDVLVQFDQLNALALVPAD